MTTYNDIIRVYDDLLRGDVTPSTPVHTTTPEVGAASTASGAGGADGTTAPLTSPPPMTEKEALAALMSACVAAPVEAWQLRQVCVLAVKAGWRPPTAAVADVADPPAVHTKREVFTAGMVRGNRYYTESCPECDTSIDRQDLEDEDIAAEWNNFIGLAAARPGPDSVE